MRLRHLGLDADCLLIEKYRLRKVSQLEIDGSQQKQVV
jgi:hypothetical protein